VICLDDDFADWLRLRRRMARRHQAQSSTGEGTPSPSRPPRPATSTGSLVVVAAFPRPSLEVAEPLVCAEASRRRV
jgi:hypothetical protein